MKKSLDNLEKGTSPDCIVNTWKCTINHRKDSSKKIELCSEGLVVGYLYE
jgi:hypothetical protein